MNYSAILRKLNKYYLRIIIVCVFSPSESVFSNVEINDFVIICIIFQSFREISSLSISPYLFCKHLISCQKSKNQSVALVIALYNQIAVCTSSKHNKMRLLSSPVIMDFDL